MRLGDRAGRKNRTHFRLRSPCPLYLCTVRLNPETFSYWVSESSIQVTTHKKTPLNFKP
ncbi:hypothetical protein CKA32_005231 [Geitlerinema sp. FC II]|nr:hypothetical protein CKA32_005231 [Geitlerinema sp. FC II]